MGVLNAELGFGTINSLGFLYGVFFNPVFGVDIGFLNKGVLNGVLPPPNELNGVLKWCGRAAGLEGVECGSTDDGGIK